MLHKHSCTCFYVDGFLDEEITLWMPGAIGRGHRCLPGAGGKEAAGVFSLALLAAIAQNFPTVLTMMWKVWQHVYFLALATAPPYKGPWPPTCLFNALTNVLASNSILPQRWTPRLPVSLSRTKTFENLVFSTQWGRAFSGKFTNYLGHKFKNQS